MKKRFWSALLLALFCGLAPVAAAEHGEAVTDPAQAGEDYQVQGEYAGEGEGVQVVALGDGKFDVVRYEGGLPGEGYDDRSQKKEKMEGKTADEVKSLVGSLKKVDRKSESLGAKAPEDAVVLFDGSNADQWHHGEMTEEGFLKAGVLSKPEFKDFTLHVEFRTPYMPKSRGQGRGNSGVYLQNLYEVQVLDSFGLEGESNECGGIYGAAKPKVNMCLPPLAWQTYDIEFRSARFDDSGNKTENARATIKHNGFVIHDDLEIPTHTPGGAPAETGKPGPIQFQEHGNPVVYRNVWVVEKK